MRLIPDLDVLNDEGVVTGIIEAYGIAWDSIQPDYKIIVSNILSGSKENINRMAAKAAIAIIMDESKEANLSPSEIKRYMKQ